MSASRLPGRLVIAASTSAPAARSRSADAWLLALDDGSLRAPDGERHEVFSSARMAAVRAAAQAHAERALAALEGGAPPRDERRLALTIAAVTKIDVYLDAVAFMRSLAIVGRALEVASPRRGLWYADDAPLAHAVVGALGARGSVRIVPSPPRRRGVSEALLAAVKRRGMDWSLRSLASLADGRPPPHADVGVDVVGVFDVRNDGMIANVGLVLRELARQGASTLALSMDRRVGAAVRAMGTSDRFATLAGYGRWSDARTAVARTRSVQRELASFWRAEAGEPHDRAMAAYTLRRFHAGYVWQTLVDASAAQRLLDEARPRAIMIASDAHRYARLLVLQARARGVPTFVLQHGAIGERDLYVPLVADHMLAWGPWCRDWFVAQRTPAARVHAVGFVRAPERRPLRGPIPEDASMLFAAQPIPDGVTRELLEAVRFALEHDARLRLVVRPHPGESRRASLDALVATWPDGVRGRVALSPPGRSLTEDLDAADAVVVSQSTVGIDALTVGVPTLLLSHERIPEVIPFHAFGGVVGAADGPELVAGLRSLRDPERLAELARGAHAFLEAYVGATGPASLSAAAALVRGASEATPAPSPVATP